MKLCFGRFADRLVYSFVRLVATGGQRLLDSLIPGTADKGGTRPLDAHIGIEPH